MIWSMRDPTPGVGDETPLWFILIMLGCAAIFAFIFWTALVVWS
jgi:hypothetical protein